MKWSGCGATNCWATNAKVIAAAQIGDIAFGRKNAKLLHIKFIVLCQNGTPKAVWTGSTNISRIALYGQLNFGQVVRDTAIASQFLAYWQKLRADPQADAPKDWTEAQSPLPPADRSAEILPIFSPHHGSTVFQWWIDLASANKPLFMTFPFGIVKDFRPVFDKDDGVLRFALLDKYVNVGTSASRAVAIAEIERIRRHPNIGMALGSNITVDWIDDRTGWVPDHFRSGSEKAIKRRYFAG